MYCDRLANAAGTYLDIHSELSNGRIANRTARRLSRVPNSFFAVGAWVGATLLIDNVAISPQPAPASFT
jgi:hypothetical protein